MRGLQFSFAFLTLCLALPAQADEFQWLEKESRTSNAGILGCTGMLKAPDRPSAKSDPVSIYYIDIAKRISQVNRELQPQFDENKKLICSLTLTPMGEIADLKIAKSSGSEVVDGDALNIVKKAAPFAERDRSRTVGNHTFWVVFFDYPNLGMSKVYVKSAPETR